MEEDSRNERVEKLYEQINIERKLIYNQLTTKAMPNIPGVTDAK